MLVHRLRASDCPAALITAPAGYGKTTLLWQWAETDPRRFAWLTVAEAGRKPLAVLEDLAAALEHAGVDCSAASAALARGGDAASVSEALRRALAALPTQIVIVLDDVHLLTSTRAERALARVLAAAGAGSQVVLAGRRPTALTRRLARSAAGALELGIADLRMSTLQAATLLRAEDVELPEPRLAEIQGRVEGWPAGLYLAALALRAQREHGAGPLEFDGADRTVGDYLREEVLSGQSRDDLELLRQASALNRTCAALCDAALGADGSEERLERLAGSDLLAPSVGLPPCGVAGRRCYRPNPMVRDALRSELERHDPELLAELRRRASLWSAANGRPYGALEYAVAAGDRQRVISLLETDEPRPADAAGVGVLEGCFDLLDDGRSLERHPAVAMLGARIHAVAGRAEEAERFARLAERGFRQASPQSEPLAPALSVTRAAMCRDGIATMRADATLAVRASAEGTGWHAEALFLLGIAELLGGAPEAAAALFEEAATAAATSGVPDVESAACAELSLLAASAGYWAQARALALRARGAAVDSGLEPPPPTSALAWIAAARSAAHTGDRRGCSRELERAHALLPRVNRALPWLAAQVRIELARVHQALAEPALAAELLDHVDDLLARGSGLGTIAAQATALRDRIAAAEDPLSGWPATLTRAERKLLPLLTTHLTFREIAASLDVSRNTVKSQAISVYRKLQVSSRGDAIDAAVELGLIEAQRPPGRSRSAGAIAPAGAPR